jgi:hypothetical protein
MRRLGRCDGSCRKCRLDPASGDKRPSPCRSGPSARKRCSVTWRKTSARASGPGCLGPLATRERRSRPAQVSQSTEDLNRDAAPAGDRADFRADEISAHARDGASLAAGLRGGVDGGVLRVCVGQRRLQDNAHGGGRCPEDRLPADGAPVLGKSGVARQRELLAGLAGAGAFVIEGQGDIARKN